MLDPFVARTVAGLIALLYIVGVILIQCQGKSPIGRSHEFRAKDNPPRALQALWEATFLIPNLYPFGVALLPAWTYGTWMNVAFPFDFVAQLVGLLLWGLGGGLAIWSARVLGRYMVVEIGVQKDHELITAGPYARIRHPTYVAVMCMLGGLALLFLSTVLAAFFVLGAFLANYRARKEERLLASEAGFGDAYRVYMARTGRFLPRLRRP